MEHVVVELVSVAIIWRRCAGIIDAAATSRTVRPIVKERIVADIPTIYRSRCVTTELETEALIDLKNNIVNNGPIYSEVPSINTVHLIAAGRSPWRAHIIDIVSINNRVVSRCKDSCPRVTSCRGVNSMYLIPLKCDVDV